MLKKDEEDLLDRSCENEEVLRIVKEVINILHTIQGRTFDGTGHILPRSCLLNHVIEGKIG